MTASARPCYFGPNGAECFGWLHLPPDDGRSDMGLVICSPVGHEDQAAYRSLRQLAITAAQSGVATLRFDYHGSGDSAGADGDHDHPSAWRRSVDAAIAALREQTQITRICLVGARLGTLAAVQAASERRDVCAFVALAPVVRGRSFLREALLRSPHPPDTDDAGFELGGHLLTAQARAELGAIDLRTCDRPPAPRVLLVSAGEVLSEHEGWRAQLQAQGAGVESFAAPELARILESEVTVAAVMVERVAAWIAAQAGPVRPRLQPLEPVASLAATLHSEGTRETPLTLSANGTDLFAIHCEPAKGSVRRAVLLLNTGSARRIGASRMHVAWSRDWARRGVAVLRLDLPGLGDSAVQPGETEGEAYLIDAAAAVDAGLALLRARHGKIDCTLMGICSGAYHAYQAALAGAAIESLVLINQASYRWLPGMHLDNPSKLLRLSWQLQAGQRSDGVVASRKTLAGRCGQLKWHAIRCGFAALGVVRDAARLLGQPLAGDVGEELRSLVRRGLSLHVVQADQDFSGPLLDLEAGSTVVALQRRGEIQRHRIAKADHIFTSCSARTRLQTALDRIVCGPVARPRGLRAIANVTAAAVPTARTGSISR